MTVGVAASCRRDDDPVVILAADRLITTQQQSRIEHEHRGTRLGESPERKLGDPVPGRGLRAERRSRDEVLSLVEELSDDEDVVDRLRDETDVIR